MAADDVPVTVPASAPVLIAPAGSQALFVELVVNGQAKGAIASVLKDGDRLMIDADALRDAGIAVRDLGPIDIAHRADVRARYDAAGQRLLLDVPAALLPMRRIGATATAAMRPLVDAGALLNYDLFVQRTAGRTRAALSTEQRAFGSWGSISNTGVLRTGGGGGGGIGRVRGGYVRLDTRYRLSNEDRVLELNAGDLITRALPWSTAVRIGGVQLTRSFAIRPDLITVPLPSFTGEAAVPTGVDLFINGYRQSRADIAPGRFVLESVPVVNGAGEARIVTTDAVGRQIATTIPFYVAPDLLRPGLFDFSMEAGALRSGYGTRSFGYGRAVLSASVRRGVTDRVTVSGHGEAARGMGAAGAGAAWAPGLWGTLNAAVAVSEAGGRTGRQVTMGYTYSARTLSFGAEHVTRSPGYTDLGGFDLGRFAGSRRSDRVSVSAPVRGFGSVGAGYLYSRLPDGTRARIASGSASMPVGRRSSAFGAIDYDFTRRTFSAQLRLVVPLGRDTVASGGVSGTTGGSARMQASIAAAPPTAGGLGYAADAAIGSGGTVIGQASATWRAERVQVEAGGATVGGERSVWAGATGSVALLGGRMFATRALPGAFALVATGAPRVPVYYENQKMGETDAGGRLFVPNVAAYHPARFAIDPVDLPIGAVAERTETRAALRAGTGAVIRLPVAFHRAVTARIVDAGGLPLPPGTIATLGDGRPATIGWDGIVMIEDAAGTVTIAARTVAGPCRASIAIGAEQAAMADIGVIACR